MEHKLVLNKNKLIKREQGFRLDCNDKSKSKIPDYNSVFDKSMKPTIPQDVIDYVHKELGKKKVKKTDFTTFLCLHKDKLLRKKEMQNCQSV